MEDKELKLEDLRHQLEFVQGRIGRLAVADRTHIKDISDLQRYIEMQKNIVEAMYFMEGL